MNFNNLNYADGNSNNQSFNEHLQNQWRINESPYSQRSQSVNQNYVVNNYCNKFINSDIIDINQPNDLIKNGSGTPLKNFNNIFEPEFSKDRDYRNYAVVNNNYYYGPNTHINKIDVKNTPLNINSNFKSSNIFGYEDAGFNNVNINNNNYHNNSFQFPNQNVNLEKLNNSCDLKKSANLNITSINNLDSNSVFVKSYDNKRTLEQTGNYSSKHVNLENNMLNITKLNTSHSKGK